MHGDLTILKKIADTKIVALHLPEFSEGYFPIDLAGVFKKEKVCGFLIEKYLERMKSLTEGTYEFKEKRPAASKVVKKKACCGSQVTELNAMYEDEILLASPVLATSMLYWACVFDNVDKKLVE